MRIRFYIFSVLALVFVSSCVNYDKAREIKNYPREFTGIEQLIRIDGYYFYQDTESIVFPFVFTNDGEYLLLPTAFNNHEEFHHFLQQNFNPRITSYPESGIHTIKNDTIKTRRISKYEIWSYRYIERDFIALNDSTLQSISVNVNGESYSSGHLYHFYPYDVSMIIEN
jgi:hypothetical protein